ncbi:hypothetical protein MASR2M66_11900 [Chloroflexota bacterium]
MNFVSFLGTLGTVIGLIRAVPQLLRLLRARESFGVSLDSAATSSIVSFGWMTYGILSNQLYVTLATGSSGLIFAVIAFFALRYGRSLKELKVAPVWFIVFLLAGMFFGKHGLGAVLPISILAANIPQLWVAYKEGNLVDLSLGTWLLSMADGLVWGTYAILQHDVSIIINGFLQLTTSGLIVALKLMHQARERNLAVKTDSRLE